MAGAGTYAHWVAALFSALSFLFLLVLLTRHARDMAELKMRFEANDEMLRKVAERLRSGAAEAARETGPADPDPWGQPRRRDWAASQDAPADLRSAYPKPSAERPSALPSPAPLGAPPSPPPGAQAARQPSGETGRRLAFDYNRLVEDVSRSMIDQFKDRWQPVEMEGTAPEQLARSEGGPLWAVRAVDAEGLDYHYVLPGEKMFLKWSTMRAGGGVGIKDLLDRFYEIGEGERLRLDQAATVYEVGGRFVPLGRGRLQGV